MALITTFTDASGVTIEVYATQTADGVKFELKSTGTETNFDLNGFFIDYGNDGGSLTHVEGYKSINMNGSSSDGDKLDGWDEAIFLGQVGGKDGFQTTAEFTVPGITLADLADAELGLRVTSVGDAGGSLKLNTTVPNPVPEDVPSDDFPTWPQDISNVVLYFTDDAGEDSAPKDGDGYYLVKIDDVPKIANDDLDTWIQDALTALGMTDEHLLGAAIKGGNDAGSTQFYAYGDHNENGTAPDPIPDGAPGIETPPAQGQVPGNEIDLTVTYGSLFP